MMPACSRATPHCMACQDITCQEGSHLFYVAFAFLSAQRLLLNPLTHSAAHTSDLQPPMDQAHGHCLKLANLQPTLKGFSLNSSKALQVDLPSMVCKRISLLHQRVLSRRGVCALGGLATTGPPLSKRRSAGTAATPARASDVCVLGSSVQASHSMQMAASHVCRPC